MATDRAPHRATVRPCREPFIGPGGNEQTSTPTSIAFADEEKREELGAQADALQPSAPLSRLRLANVVLEAGFPGDAVRAAYEGLSSGVRAQLSADAPPSHAELVAAVYRELVPAGRAPAALHGALARLYDLSQLEAHGVLVEHALATDEVAEAEAWISRLDEDAAAQRAISASHTPASIASMELS